MFVLATRRPSRNATVYLAVYRKFVEAPPTLRLITPEKEAAALQVQEDTGGFCSFVVGHKAAAEFPERQLTVYMNVSHGDVHSLSKSAVVKSVRRMHNQAQPGDSEVYQMVYQAPLEGLNEFLAQLEYIPFANYHGPDELVLAVEDPVKWLDANGTEATREHRTARFSLPIEVLPVDDAPTLLCPAGVDLKEGEKDVLVGGDIGVQDNDKTYGAEDVEELVTVELRVEAGGLTLGTEGGVTFAAPGRDPYPAAQLKFNCNMRSLRPCSRS